MRLNNPQTPEEIIKEAVINSLGDIDELSELITERIIIEVQPLRRSKTIGVICTNGMTTVRVPKDGLLIRETKLPIPLELLDPKVLRYVSACNVTKLEEYINSGLHKHGPIIETLFATFGCITDKVDSLRIQMLWKMVRDRHFLIIKKLVCASDLSSTVDIRHLAYELRDYKPYLTADETHEEIILSCAVKYNEAIRQKLVDSLECECRVTKYHLQLTEVIRKFLSLTVEIFSG